MAEEGKKSWLFQKWRDHTHKLLDTLHKRTDVQPVLSLLAMIHVVQIQDGNAKYLLLQGADSLKNRWQIITGKVHEGEQIITAAKRELFKETGLIPEEFYSADFIEHFFLPEKNLVVAAPVFLAFINQRQSVKLSIEYNAYRWFHFEEALIALRLESERYKSLIHIEEQFIKQSPNHRFLLKPEEN